jgi:hypothetical protein
MPPKECDYSLYTEWKIFRFQPRSSQMRTVEIWEAETYRTPIP